MGKYNRAVAETNLNEHSSRWAYNKISEPYLCLQEKIGDPYNALQGDVELHIAIGRV